MEHSSKLEEAQALAFSADLPSLNLAFALYDPEADGTSAPWLMIAALASMSPGSQNFNIPLACDLALVAAIKGGGEYTLELLHDLHLHYLGAGKDVAAALVWLEEDDGSSERLSQRFRKGAQIFLDHDRRFCGSDVLNQASPYVLKKLEAAIGKGNFIAPHLMGALFLRGDGVKKNIALGRAWLYTSLFYSLQDIATRDQAAQNSLPLLLTHTLFGTNAETAFRSAQAIYQRHGDCLGQTAKQSWGDFFDQGNGPEFQTFISECVQAFYGEKDWSTVKSFIAEQAGTRNYKVVYGILYHLHLISLGLQCKSDTPWKHLLHLAENCHHEITEASLQQSTEETGPRYNAIASDGTSILGVWERAASSATVRQGSYVPQGGAQRLLSIKTDEKGKIHYKTEKDGRLPAKLLLEDFRVAEALVFGRRDYLEEGGSFSLEGLLEGLANAETREPLRRKVWKPAWLGQTDFGKTLYAIDALAGGFVFTPFSLSIGRPEHSVSGDMPNLIADFLQTLGYMSGLPSGRDYWRLMVLAEDPEASVEIKDHRNGTQTYHFSKISVRMQIDGDEREREAGTNETFNNPTYRGPRTTAHMTNHYEFLKLCAPVFARAEELFRLLNALIFLKQSGYIPPTSVARRIEKNLARYEMLPLLPEKSLLCRLDHYTFNF